MAAIAVRKLDSFRAQWVSGHLDYQRAAEALETAEHAVIAARRAPRDGGGEGLADHDPIDRAESNLARARQRLAEIEAILGGQFDRFCGVTR